MNRTFSFCRMNAQVASVSNLVRSTRAGTSSRTPRGACGRQPGELERGADASLVLALDLLLKRVIEEVRRAQVLAARFLDDSGRRGSVDPLRARRQCSANSLEMMVRRFLFIEERSTSWT
ncbi:MAG: hypothetical protein U5R14_01815 [Gemmatimonadota bacterium]|nr:hypothetical protein [Gemmatimonadota bacterium]